MEPKACKIHFIRTLSDTPISDPKTAHHIALLFSPVMHTSRHQLVVAGGFHIDLEIDRIRRVKLYRESSQLSSWITRQNL